MADLCSLEGSAGSLADFVQLVLQGVNLPFNLFEGRALRGDEQVAILASGVGRRATLTLAGLSGVPNCTSSSMAPKTCKRTSFH